MFIRLCLFQRQLQDLSKQKALDADPRAIQKIVYQGKSGQKLKIYTALEKSKQTVLEFKSLKFKI